MSYFSSKKLLVTLFLILLPQISIARFISEKEASVRYDVVNDDIKVYKDFSIDWTIEEQKTLLNESAREGMNLVQLHYQEDFQSIKVLEAKTIDNGEHLVDFKLIEDKTLASEASGFSDIRQVSIPFQNVNVGSKIFLKYLMKMSKPQIEKHLSKILRYGDHGYLQNSLTTIESEIPLFLHKNDPFNVLKIENHKKEGIYYYRIELIKPFTAETVNEPRYSILPADLQTYVAISTDDSWKDFGRNIAAKYEDILAKSSFSDEFLSAIKKAKEIKGDVDRINYVTSFIQDKIRYLGDWKTTERGFYPREIQTIIKTQYGDCKDFSAMTVAMLRELDFKANFVLVERGEIVANYDYKIPVSSAFNHAITYVESKDGKSYWIDTTNRVSMAQGVFPDIADRYALILDTKNSRYTKIPPINYLTNKVSIESIYNLKQKEILKESNVVFSNESAKFLTGSDLFFHKDITEDYVYSNFTEENISKKDRLNTVISDLSSRIVKDINISLKYILKNPYAKTNLGKAITLQRHGFDYPSDSVEDIYLRSPETFIKKYVFDQEVKNADILNAEISTPWVTLKRTGYIEKGKTIILNEYVIKKSYLTKQDRESKEYDAFKAKVNSNFKNPLIVFPEE